MKRLFAAIAAGLSIMFSQGCQNMGSARTAADPLACELLSIAVGNETLATVCDDMVDVVGDIIARSLPPAGPLAQAGVGADGARFEFVTLNGRAIGLVRADLAATVQAQLNE